jgi:hypothetical protein
MASIEASITALESRVTAQQAESQHTAGLLQLVSSLSALLTFDSAAKANKRKLTQFGSAFKAINGILDETASLLENYADRKARSAADSSRKKDLELRKAASRVKKAEDAARTTSKSREVVVKEFQVMLNEESQTILGYLIAKLQDLQAGLQTLSTGERGELEGKLKEEQAKLSLVLEDLRHFEEIQGPRLSAVKPASSRGQINREELKHEILQKAKDRLISTFKRARNETDARLLALSTQYSVQFFEIKTKVDEAHDQISKQAPPPQSEEDQLKTSNEATRLMISHLSSFVPRSLRSLGEQCSELETTLSAPGVDLKAHEDRFAELKTVANGFSTRSQAACYRIEANLKANNDLFNKLNRSSPDRSIAAEQPKIKRLSAEYQTVKESVLGQLETVNRHVDKLAGFYPKKSVPQDFAANAMVPKAAVISDDEELDEGSFGSDDFSDEDD